MRDFCKQLLKSSVPAAVVLAGIGYWLAEYAGGVVASQQIERASSLATDLAQSSPSTASTQLTHQLRWRLPLTLAAWGFGITFVIEFLRSLWTPPATTATDDTQVALGQPAPQTVDELLNELAARVEAERMTTSPEANKTSTSA